MDNVRDTITCAKFQIGISVSYTSARGRLLYFPIDCCVRLPSQ